MWWPLRKTRQYRYVSESMNYWSNYWNKRCVDKHFTLRTTFCTLFENAIRISTLLSTILLLVGYEIQIAPWTLVFIQQTSTQNAGCHTKLSPRRGHQISAGLRTANPPTSATIIDFRGKTWRLFTVFTTHYPLVDPPPPLLATGCTPTRLALIHWKMAYATNWFPFSTVVGKAADYETIFSSIFFPLPLVVGLVVLRLPPLQQLNLKSTKKHRNTTIHQTFESKDESTILQLLGVHPSS